MDIIFLIVILECPPMSLNCSFSPCPCLEECICCIINPRNQIQLLFASVKLSLVILISQYMTAISLYSTLWFLASFFVTNWTYVLDFRKQT
jgi:hypothetical protein